MLGATSFSRGVRGVALASIAIAVVLFAAVSALAIHVDPVFTEGNPKCPDGTTEFKIDGQGFSNGQKSSGPILITISNFNGQTATFDWTSNIGVDQVIVKGGDNANVYTYNPESTGDTGLHTPFNQNSGQNYGLSHVSWCYDVEQTTSPSPSPSSPSPSVSPSESESPSPSPSVSPSETESPSPSVSVLPTSTASVLGKKLSKTGSDIIRLALFALALIVLGAAAYAVSTRASRSDR